MYTEVKPTWSLIIEFPQNRPVTFESAQYALQVVLEACLAAGYPLTSASASSTPRLIVILTLDDFRACEKIKGAVDEAIKQWQSWERRYGHSAN